MDCADEAALIRHALARPGIESLNFDLVGRRVDVTFNPGTHLRRRDPRRGRGHRPCRPPAPGRRSCRRRSSRARSSSRHREMVGGRQRRRVRRSAGSSTASTPTAGARRSSAVTASTLGHAHHPYAAVAYGIAAFAGLWPMIPRALTSLRFARLDMHVLVCLSAVGAAAIGQWAEAAAVAFLFAIAHLMEAWSIERARHAVSTLVGHEPGWGDDSGHEVGAGRALDRAVRGGLHAGRDLRRDRRGAGAAALRRPVGRVVLSRPDFPGARVPVRAGDLDAGDGGRGADLGGAARRAVQGRRAARARRHREVADAAGRARNGCRRAVPHRSCRRAGSNRRSMSC